MSNTEKEARYALADVEKAVSDIYSLVARGHHDFHSSNVLEAAYTLEETVRMFIEVLEDKDDNLNLEKTKLPNVDDIFKGHPVNDYVKALVELASAKPENKAEAQRKATAAAERVAKRQNETVAEEVSSEKGSALDEFIDYVVDRIDFADAAYAAMFKRELAMAISTLKERNGYAKFITKQKFGQVEGELRISGDDISIKIGNDSYSFIGCIAPVEGEPEYVFCGEYPETDYVSEEETCQYVGGVCQSSETVKEVNPVEDLNTKLDMIAEHLNGLNYYAREDLELIRTYLKHLSKNSADNIDSLSDRVLELAWKQMKYVRGLI